MFGRKRSKNAAESVEADPSQLDETGAIDGSVVGSVVVESAIVEAEGVRVVGPDPGAAPTFSRGRPDDIVLDELSKAFGADDAPETDDPTQPPTQPADAPETDDPTQPPTQPVAAPESLAPDGSAEVGSAEATAGSVVISIGGDDELPDAVYLDDESALGDASGSTVFIDDDGTGDAIAPKDATAPGIEPRLRQRRIGVRRAASRQRLKWVVLGVLVAGVLLAVLSLLGSSLFAVDEVDVSGNQYTDVDALQRVVDDLIDTPVLLVDTRAAEAELESIPWVEDARVRTDFPNRATIEIRERTPVATMRGADGMFRVLDATGRILDVIEGQPVAFVWISGVGTLDQPAGEFALVGPSAAASLVTKLTPTVRPLVVSIDVTPGGTDLVLNMAPPPDGGSSGIQTLPFTVRFGSAIGDGEQIEKLVRLEKKLGDLPDRQVSEINVATDEVTVL